MWLLCENIKAIFAVSVSCRHYPGHRMAAYPVFSREDNVTDVTQVMAMPLAKNIASKAMQIQKVAPIMPHITYSHGCVVGSVGRFSDCQLK